MASFSRCRVSLCVLGAARSARHVSPLHGTTSACQRAGLARALHPTKALPSDCSGLYGVVCMRAGWRRTRSRHTFDRWHGCGGQELREDPPHYGQDFLLRRRHGRGLRDGDRDGVFQHEVTFICNRPPRARRHCQDHAFAAPVQISGARRGRAGAGRRGSEWATPILGAPFPGCPHHAARHAAALAPSRACEVLIAGAPEQPADVHVRRGPRQQMRAPTSFTASMSPPRSLPHRPTRTKRLHARRCTRTAP